jgi:hypothetical protein
MGGNIDSGWTPRLLFEFEGVIAHVPPGSRRNFELYQRLRRWRRMVELFEPEPYTAKRLVDLFWRRDFRIDVVTFLPAGAVPHVREWLDVAATPYGHLLHYPDRAALGRALATMPEVYCVGYGEESARFTYGQRGRLCTATWDL